MKKDWKKKSLYIASFIQDNLDEYGNKIRVYAKPEYIGKENIQPLGSTGFSNYGIVEKEFGDKVTLMQKVLLDWFLIKKDTITLKRLDKSNLKKVNSLKITDFNIKNERYLNDIKEKDLAYLDGASPEGEEVYGDNANYRVSSVRKQNKKIAIYFERLPNK